MKSMNDYSFPCYVFTFCLIALKVGKFDIIMFCYKKILGCKTHPKLEAMLEKSRRNYEKMLRLSTEKIRYLVVVGVLILL